MDIEKTRKQRLYYVDNWLPSGRAHLIAGPSGVGKTTLLFDMIRAWQNQDEWLGRETHGQNLGKFVYVIGDRGRDEAEETMERLDVDSNFQYQVVDDIHADPGAFFEVPSDTRIIAIDAAERLVEGGKLVSFDAVMKGLFYARLQAQKRNCAVILLVGSPKMKKNEEYVYGRERVLGSSAWGRFASTIFDLRFVDPQSMDDPNRVLQIYPRNTKPKEFSLKIGSEGFDLAVTDPKEASFRMQLTDGMSPGVWYERSALLSVSKASGVSDSTLDRALRQLTEKTILERVHGRYRRPLVMLGQQAPILGSTNLLESSNPAAPTTEPEPER